MREYTGTDNLNVTMCDLYFPVFTPFLKCGEFLKESSFCRITGVACLAFTEHTAVEQFKAKKSKSSKSTS